MSQQHIDYRLTKKMVKSYCNALGYIFIDCALSYIDTPDGFHIKFVDISYECECGYVIERVSYAALYNMWIKGRI